VEEKNLQQTENIIANVTEAMPKVNPDINQMQLPGLNTETKIEIPKVIEPKTDLPKKPVDSNGMEFDPKIHEHNKDGSPRLSSTGNLLRKRGRGAAVRKINIPTELQQPQSQPIPPVADEPKIIPAEPPQADNADLQLQAAAEITAQCFYQIGVAAFSTEWLPESDEENANMVEVIKKYYASKGITDIPPGALLAIVVAGYALKRFQKPITLSKMQKLTLWTKTKLSALWLKFKARKSAAQSLEQNKNAA